MSTTVRIEGDYIELTTNRRSHTICLNVEPDRDIASIRFGGGGGHEGIERIELRIGTVTVGSLRNAGAQLMPLPAGGLKMSKIWAMHVYLIVHYNEKYIGSKCQYAEEDEYEQIVNVSDECLEFVDADTGEIREGYVRTSKRVRTGRKVRVLSQGAVIQTPDVEIEVCEPSTSTNPAYYWEEVRISPDANPDYIKRLTILHSLTATDMHGVSKVRNILQYCDGMVGPLYTISGFDGVMPV